MHPGRDLLGGDEDTALLFYKVGHKIFYKVKHPLMINDYDYTVNH